jgi:hypothetical protein
MKLTMLEEIEKACAEACSYFLFEPNTEFTIHSLKGHLNVILHQMYHDGWKITDRFGDPIDNIEDVEVSVQTSQDGHADAYFVPTTEYWNRKMEKYVRDFEGLIASLQADAAMEFFDPCI